MRLNLASVVVLLILLVGCSAPATNPVASVPTSTNQSASTNPSATHAPAATDAPVAPQHPAATEDTNVATPSDATKVSQVPPTPLAVKVNGNTLRVEDSSTTLNGMMITQLEGNSALAQVNLGKVDSDAVPQTPEWVTPLSDVFIAQTPLDQDVELRFPLRNLPENVSIGDVHLQAYTEAVDVAGRIWAPVSITTSYEGTPQAPIIVVALGGLEGFAFWGYTKPQNASATRFENRLLHTSFSQARVMPQNAATCTQQSPLAKPIDSYICSTTDVTVTVDGFGNTTHWGDVTKEQMVGWLSAAQKAFPTYGLSSDTMIKVSIHPITDDVGFVTGSDKEDYKTIHLTNDDAVSASTMQGITVHEYFHNAQARSGTIEGGNVFIDSHNNDDAWITEGTARWFEDELYDDLNTYVALEKRGSRIAEVGIHRAEDITAQGSARPYQRFSFFKLLNQSCPDFKSKLKSIFRVQDQWDTTGINNLIPLFKEFNCKFGDHLGAENSSSLAAALSYYNYATQFEDNISLLDLSESDAAFRFEKPYTFVTGWDSIDQWSNSPTHTVSLERISFLGTASAHSFTVRAISGQVPEGKVAELVITATLPITVSITSSDSKFIGMNTIGPKSAPRSHTWFSTAQQTSYIYNFNRTVPELFVTLVNPSLDELNSPEVAISFQIRDASEAAEPTVSSVVAPTTTVASVAVTQVPAVATQAPVTTAGPIQVTQKLLLSIDQIDDDLQVLVNGTEVYTHSIIRHNQPKAEFDITTKLRPGRNTVEIIAKNRLAAGVLIGSLTADGQIIKTWKIADYTKPNSPFVTDRFDIDYQGGS